MKDGETLTARVAHRTSLLFVALASLLAACGVTQSTEPPVASTVAASPSPTPPVTPTESATPPASTPSAAAQPGGLGPDAVARVVTRDLVVRSRPEISDESQILSPTLNMPTLVFVVDGPVSADGYDWYQVQPFGMHYLDYMQGQPPFGWVAASSREGEAWIAPAELECPDLEIDAVRAMTDVARFACYGDQDDLTLEGQFGGCFVADPAIITPEWLYQTGCFLVPPGYQPGHVLPDPGGLPMRSEGDVGMPFDDPVALVRVTGHFDDPVARTCQPYAGSVVQLESAEAVLLCRAQFVVTDVERLDGP